ncbi:MAG: dihydroxy-acid dehydratase [Bryobacterales bacterium]
MNRQVPRIVDVLPNGPQFFKTVQAFLAGGVPEVMLHLRGLGLLRLDAMTVSGQTVGENLEWWENPSAGAACAPCSRNATVRLRAKSS